MRRARRRRERYPFGYRPGARQNRVDGAGQISVFDKMKLENCAWMAAFGALDLTLRMRQHFAAQQETRFLNRERSALPALGETRKRLWFDDTSIFHKTN